MRAGLYRCRGRAWFDDVRLTDEAGRVLLDSTFETAPDADRQIVRNWWRSDVERCTWQTAVVHSGTNALQTTLGFEIPRLERLNTRHGRPADGLEVEPTQLGVFQADYPLERAIQARTAPMQAVVPAGLALDGPLEGWAACGVVGWNHARWVPLIHTYDRYGRLRGAAGGLLRHYAGPWAGSSWAIFGVTNRDLFASGQPAMSEAFVRIVHTLVHDTYLTSLTTEHACYQPGETVRFQLPVFNGGRHSRQLQLHLEVFPGQPANMSNPSLPGSRSGRSTSLSEPVVAFTLPVRVESRQTQLATCEWSPAKFSADFYHVTARLEEGGRDIDRMAGGFGVWNPEAVASGPRLTLRDNYLRFGKRPLFLFGTDDWSYVFQTARETPLQWLEDMRLRRDFGVLIYENLQFGLPAPPERKEALLRKVDGIVQLTQTHGQVYFPGLLIGYNAAASETDLAAQREYGREFARRHRRVPGLIYYLNGDYRCELTEAVTPEWNEFLRDRYGSHEHLASAWSAQPPHQALGQIPADDYHDWEQTWDDVSAYDRNCFRAWLLRRWNRTLISGIREEDSIHPTSGEFYQVPHGGVDLPAGIDGLDLANFGFFEKPGVDLAKFPGLCVYNDQRARGKSGGPGEYGVKTHPAWGDGRDYGYHTARTREQAIELFLAIPHCALGLGASRIHNWCWKDDAHRVFPWGMIYPCDGVPKDTAYVHRNLSLLFRHFAPVYQEPTVYVLTPDSHRLGGAKWKVIHGILASIDLALALHIPNLGTLNEMGLEIPRSARAIYYPLPFCPPDEAYGKILNWVHRGGVLYLSGDISFDELRRRSRTQRLEELCGVRFVSQNYSNLAVRPADPADQPCIQVEALGATVIERTPSGAPLRVEHRVGRGRVLFTSDPIELHSTEARQARNLGWYRRVLEMAGVAPLALDPDDPRLLLLQVPLRDGGKVWIVGNFDERATRRTVALQADNHRLTLTVARRRPALAWWDGAGNLRAIESQGQCTVDGEWVVQDGTSGAVLTLDGRDIRRSRAMVWMPLQPGSIRWQSDIRWNMPVVETGEIREGTWQTGETQAVDRSPGELGFAVSADQAFSWLLVCDREVLSRWRKALERAMTAPQSLP